MCLLGARSETEKENRLHRLILPVLLLLHAAVLVCICFLLFSDTGGKEEKTVSSAQTGFYSARSVYADSLYTALPQDTSFNEALMNHDMRALAAQNGDFVGWLCIDGTSVDFPVYQADDNDTYLRTDAYGNEDRRGSVFMDYRCGLGLSRTQFSACTILYGHHLIHDISIFAEIENYLDIDYYRSHPTVHFDTLYGDYTWLVVGCFLTDADSFYYLNTEFDSDASFLSFAEEVSRRSRITNPSVTVEAGDKLLLLSTCTYSLDNAEDGRCVLVCRLVRQGESGEPDTDGAFQTEDPYTP